MTNTITSNRAIDGPEGISRIYETTIPKKAANIAIACVNNIVDLRDLPS